MPSIAKARQEFTDLLGRAHYAGERIPVTRRDTPYAYIISDKEMAEFEKQEHRDKALQKLAVESGYDTVDELLAFLKKNLKDLASDEELNKRRRDMKRK